jgi:hypothetical protein
MKKKNNKIDGAIRRAMWFNWKALWHENCI